MKKIFLYDPASVTKNTLSVMQKKKYFPIELTDDPDLFWRVVADLGKGDIFVLLSHGDKKGPLAVKGEKGKDIDLVRFAKELGPKDVTLYLLSCYTGLDPCASTLTAYKIFFVAPKGKAEFQTVGAETINVFSKTGEDFPGWSGSEKLMPSRPNKALSLP